VTDGSNGITDRPAGNDSDEAVFLERPEPATAGCEANLSVTKTASDPRVPPGGQVMYTLLVRNHGPDTATDAKVSDAIPSGLEIRSAVPDHGKCTAADTVDCSLGTIPSGGAVEILITATVSDSASGSIDNCATASAFQADPDPGNNSDCDAVTVAPSSSSITADIQIVDHAERHLATPGEPLTDTLDVTDHGPDAAPDATVTDASSLPLDVLSIQPGRGRCTDTELFTCHLGSIADGETVKITIRAIPTEPGTEIDSAIATSGCTKSGLCDLNTDPAHDAFHATTMIIAPHPPSFTG
jgi:large repetitive protein